MKYLAAYALLALSGKKDISTSHPTQPPRILNPSSVAFNPMPLMPKLTRSSTLSRARLSTSSFLRVRADSELAPDLLPPRSLTRRTIRRKKSPRRRRRPRSPSPRRRRHPKNNKMPIWEISSDDRYA